MSGHAHEIYSWSIKNDYYDLPTTQPYHPNFMPISIPIDTPATTSDVVIITDCTDENTKLAAMLAPYKKIIEQAKSK